MSKPHQIVCRYDATADGGTGQVQAPWESFIVPSLESESLVLADLTSSFASGMALTIAFGASVWGFRLVIEFIKSLRGA